MIKLREDRVEIMPDDRQNTSIIENNYTRESLIIQQKFEKVHKEITKLI